LVLRLSVLQGTRFVETGEDMLGGGLTRGLQHALHIRKGTGLRWGKN
jgi:hypothetical protein